MLRPLSGADRRALMMWSVALCATSVLLGPLAAQSSGDVTAVEAGSAPVLRTPELPQRVGQTSVRLIRDPFEPDAPLPGHNESNRIGTEGRGLVGTAVVAGAPMNASLDPSRASRIALPADGDTVLAVITGGDAEALIEQGGRTEIVRVGGFLGGVRIVAITSDGVRLANGSLLRLDEGRP